MPGKLTKLFSTPHFTIREDAHWIAFLTFTNCERKAKTRLDKYAIENYLPFMTVHSTDDGKPAKKLQLMSTIFARCDLRDYPSLYNHQNCICRQPNHAGDRQKQVMLVMESCWQIEQLSELFDVERVKSSTPPGTPCQVSGGPLSGSTGYCDETQTFFFLPLPEMGTYAKISLKGKITLSA